MRRRLFARFVAFLARELGPECAYGDRALASITAAAGGDLAVMRSLLADAQEQRP
jgi:hypothetical protein